MPPKSKAPIDGRLRINAPTTVKTLNEYFPISKRGSIPHCTTRRNSNHGEKQLLIQANPVVML